MFDYLTIFLLNFKIEKPAECLQNSIVIFFICKYKYKII